MENRLKELRKAKGLTQEQFADIVGISQSYISDLEKGKKDIDFGLAARFAKVLGVKPYEIMPKEWQPDELSEEEKEFLRLFRKSKETHNDSADTSAKTG